MRQLFLFFCTVAVALCASCKEGAAVSPAVPREFQPEIAHIDPTTEGDREIFGRLANTFVASERTSSGGVPYFAQPKPYDEWLCRVDLIRLPAWIVTNRRKEGNEFWADDVTVDRAYAAWRSPSEPSSQNRDQACRDFRKFDSLFFAVDSDNPSRLIFLLDKLLRDISTEGARYPLICKDFRENSIGATCNPAEAFQGISIASQFTGRVLKYEADHQGTQQTEELLFDIPSDEDHPVILTLTLDSTRRFGEESNGEATIQSAKIAIEVL